MESWKKVFHNGLVPCLTDNHLELLLQGLLKNDSRLLQGITTSPPPLHCVLEWPVEGACLVGYCAWLGDDLYTVGEVEEAFAHICYQIDQNIGELSACRWLLNWFDEVSREDMRDNLIKEVKIALNIRRGEIVNEDQEIWEIV